MSGDDHAGDPAADREVGLCAGCVHASRQPSAKGSVFWRCRAADRDESLLRYPPLPVSACHAFEPVGPGPGSTGRA